MLRRILQLGRFYEGTKDYEKAEQYLSEALNSRHSFIQDDDDVALIDCQQHLAHVCAALGRTEFAEGLHLSIVNRRIAKLGLGHPSTNLILGNFGFLLESNGKIEAAQAIAQKYLIPLLETGLWKIVRFGNTFHSAGILTWGLSVKTTCLTIKHLLPRKLHEFGLSQYESVGTM